MFRTAELDANRLHLAYPLVQARYPSLSLDAWLSHAKAHLDGGNCHADGMAGVVGVETVQGYIIGLFTYRVLSCLQRGHVLECEDLVALSLYDSKSVVEALIDGIYRIARKKGCSAVRVHFHGDDDPLEEAIREAGLAREGVNYCRPLDPPVISAKT